LLLLSSITTIKYIEFVNKKNVYIKFLKIIYNI
jgi:hypothetical protein